MNSENKNLLILGAGQYGIMAAEIAREMNFFDHIAFLDDSFTDKVPELAEGPNVIGSIRDIEKFADKFHYGFVAIGNPKLRRSLIEKLESCGLTLATIVHPTAYLSLSSKVKEGCCIEPMAVVQTGAIVARASFVSSGAVIRHNAMVGEFCHIDCNAIVQSMVKVPEGTRVACNSVYNQGKG